MYFGVDLLDLYRRKISLRKVTVFIHALPPESATMTAIRVDTPLDDNGEEANAELQRWSSEEMLTAQVIDELRVLQYTLVKINSAKGSRIAEPKPVPRPGVKKPGKRKPYTPEQLRRLDPRIPKE